MGPRPLHRYRTRLITDGLSLKQTSKLLPSWGCFFAIYKPCLSHHRRYEVSQGVRGNVFPRKKRKKGSPAKKRG